MKTRVVIVGAGFAGISAAKILARGHNVEVIIIDRRNYHLFQPLLYQVATAGLSPADIAFPIRSIFRDRPNIEVILGNVTNVDLQQQKISLDDCEVLYDFLIIACGTKHSYFGHPQWEDSAPGLKTLEQATEIRRRILLAYELAEREEDELKRLEYLTFVIVGGGPTGVELAGAIGEISRYTLQRDFRRIDPATTRIILIEAGPRILPSFDEKLSRRAARDLKDLGADLWLSTRVTEVLPEGVRIGQELIRAHTVIWAAGVQPSSLSKTLGVPLDPQGRVIVRPDLTIPDHENVYVLGDQAMVKDSSGQSLPGLAAVAMQEGRWAARNILRTLKNQSRLNFVYFDKGQMATIGRSRAVAQMKSFRLDGFIAWLAWLLVHIFYLIGFKNRMSVFLQWTWSYMTLKRGARLILDKEWRSR